MLGVRDRSSALVFTVQFNREGWLARRHRVLINGFIMLDLVFKFSAKTSLILTVVPLSLGEKSARLHNSQFLHRPRLSLHIGPTRSLPSLL